MKILLIILLVLQILAGGISFITLLAQSFLLALLFLFLTVLQVTLTVAVIRHCEDLDDLRYELERLRGAVRELQKVAEQEAPESPVQVPVDAPAQVAQNTWVCVKCGTVNKADISRCAHCGAAYSVSVNPTDDPNVKRELSRWVKEGKKRSGLFGKKANS
ncbi:MAG: zinc finger Ran-binding domain-containing family 2 protein [Clostridia bacterium]|nr:zinc finger Ran-binding domain-containing family 2 protein [Clostridia bacterium]